MAYGARLAALFQRRRRQAERRRGQRQSVDTGQRECVTPAIGNEVVPGCPGGRRRGRRKVEPQSVVGRLVFQAAVAGVSG
jgi:hypothetical protein